MPKTHTQPFTHTPNYVHTLTHSYTPTHIYTHPHSQATIDTLTHTFKHTHPHSQATIHTLTLSFKHTHPQSQATIHTLIHTFKHTHLHSHARTQPHTLPKPWMTDLIYADHKLLLKVPRNASICYNYRWRSFESTAKLNQQSVLQTGLSMLAVIWKPLNIGPSKASKRLRESVWVIWSLNLFSIN